MRVGVRTWLPRPRGRAFHPGRPRLAHAGVAGRELRRTCADAGIAVSGLHWLLAAPAGLSITTVDRAVWQKSVDVLRSSVELCADLGGDYLVHGSPAQRRVGGPDDARRAEEAWRIAASEAGQAGVTYCLEPLARPDCNFVNTLAEAADVVKRNGNPAFGIMIDTLAAGLEEKEPVVDVVRRWMPTGLVAHMQFNDRSRRGPGQGDDRFGPIVQALRETGYAGWIAMEPFVYEPDGPTCAARMIVTSRVSWSRARRGYLRSPVNFVARFAPKRC